MNRQVPEEINTEQLVEGVSPSVLLNKEWYPTGKFFDWKDGTPPQEIYELRDKA